MKEMWEGGIYAGIPETPKPQMSEYERELDMIFSRIHMHPDFGWVSQPYPTDAERVAKHCKNQYFVITPDRIFACFSFEGPEGRSINYDATIADRLRVIDAAMKREM